MRVYVALGRVRDCVVKHKAVKEDYPRDRLSSQCCAYLSKGTNLPLRASKNEDIAKRPLGISSERRYAKETEEM
jgi:hypothetical protein